MGGNSVVNPLGHNFLGTGGTPLSRPLSAIGTGGLSEFTQRNPFGAPIHNPLASAFGNGNTSQPQSVPGPFALDQAQFEGDRAAINDLGKNQYDATVSSINQNADEQSKYAGDVLKRMTPGIEEDLNAKHLLNSTALQGELGRQASSLAQDVASQRANAISQALSGRQGFETGALQRGLSLEDFINQANVAKTIGAQMAPQVGNGKGSAVAGLGAGATAGAGFGPWGSAVGGGLGALIGSNRSGK